MPSVYDILNQKFKEVSKVVLGEDIGDLNEYENWLLEYSKPLIKREANGETVNLLFTFKDVKGKFIPFSKINFNQRFEPLDINEIKDIDSIIEAIRERDVFRYAGNILLGNSKYVDESTNIRDSSFVYKSSAVFESSKYISHSYSVRLSSYVFGSYFVGEISHSIAVLNHYRVTRAFSSSIVTFSSDIYYSHLIDGSSNCFFCFNASGLHYAIGNRELSREKYESIKDSLLSQIVDELLSKKKVLGLFDMFREEGEEIEEAPVQKPQELINKMFSQTTHVLLNRDLGNIEEYIQWLEEPLPSKILIAKSQLTGDNVEYVYDPPHVPPKRRICKIYHTKKISDEDLNDLTIANVKEKLSDIAYFNVKLQRDTINAVQSPLANRSSNIYRVVHAYRLKNAACSYYPISGSHNFGAINTFMSTHTIHTFFSDYISRGFEVDNSYRSEDVYFSHNVENVHDCFFCFNVKNLRNAIGNAPYSKEKYNSIKDSLLSQISDELMSKKRFRWSIYNIGVR